MCQLYGAKNWWSHSAHLLPVNKWEVGIFQPLRYGYSETMEISCHPILFFIMPNASFKIPHKDIGGWTTASKHSFVYPTSLLNLLSRGINIGGNIASLIPPNLHVPPMIGFSNEWLMSKSSTIADITLHGGLDLGIVFGELDSRSSIDLPLIYHRMAVYYNTWGIDMGLDIYKQFTNKIGIHSDIDFHFFPGFEGAYDIEHKFLFIWNNSERFQIITGYKFIYGQFPHGSESRFLPYIPLVESWFPLIEIQFSNTAKKTIKS